jgi:hypothetical protein
LGHGRGRERIIDGSVRTQKFGMTEVVANDRITVVALAKSSEDERDQDAKDSNADKTTSNATNDRADFDTGTSARRSSSRCRGGMRGRSRDSHTGRD